MCLCRTWKPYFTILTSHKNNKLLLLHYLSTFFFLPQNPLCQNRKALLFPTNSMISNKLILLTNHLPNLFKSHPTPAKPERQMVFVLTLCICLQFNILSATSRGPVGVLSELARLDVNQMRRRLRRGRNSPNGRERGGGKWMSTGNQSGYQAEPKGE